jgi:hypothetical protein
MLHKKIYGCFLCASLIGAAASAQTFTTGLTNDFSNPNSFAWRLGRVSIGQSLTAAPAFANDFNLRVFGRPIAQVQTGVYGSFAAANQWIGLGQNPVLSTIYGVGMFRDDRYAFYNLQTTTRNSVATKDLIIGAGSTGGTYDANQRILIKGFFSPAGTNSRTLASFNPGTGAMGINEESPASTLFINATTAFNTSTFRSIFILNNGLSSNIAPSTFSALGQEGNSQLNLPIHGLRVQAGNLAANTPLIASNFTVNTTNQAANSVNSLSIQPQEAEIQWQDLNYATAGNTAIPGTLKGNNLDRISFYFRAANNTAVVRKRVMTILGGGHVGINVPENFNNGNSGTILGNPFTEALTNPFLIGNSSSAHTPIRLHVNGGSVVAEGYFAVSDSGRKSNVQGIPNALDIIKSIQGHKYEFNNTFPSGSVSITPVPIDTIIQPIGPGAAPTATATSITPAPIEPPTDPTADGISAKVEQYGFIAQEIARAVPQAAARLGDGRLGVAYDQIIPILVEGIKQQQTNIVSQATEITALKELTVVQAQQLKTLTEWTQKLAEKTGVEAPVLIATPAATAGRAATAAAENNTGTVSGNRLLQNSPNPSNGYTEIFYTLEEGVMGAINIVDQQGRISKTFNNLPKGNGKVVINRGDLNPGTYTYTLLVNGQRAGSKQLVIVR